MSAVRAPQSSRDTPLAHSPVMFCAHQVDPLATLAIFKVMKVDPTTSAVASGEAVLNDAVSIVVFESVLSLFYTHSNSRIVDFGSVPLQFVIVFFGSIFIGVAGGLASAIITKYLPLKMNFLFGDSVDAGHKFIYPGGSLVNDDFASERLSSGRTETDNGEHDNRMYLEVGHTTQTQLAAPFVHVDDTHLRKRPHSSHVSLRSVCSSYRPTFRENPSFIVSYNLVALACVDVTHRIPVTFWLHLCI
jgi:hypothetical protein